jgi:hypothetical protein
MGVPRKAFDLAVMTGTAPEFQRLNPKSEYADNAAVCEMCAPTSFSSYCNPFSWARQVHCGRQRRRMQEQQQRQATAIKVYAEHRHRAIKMWKEHCVENESSLRLAEKYVEEGKHEEAEQLWGQLKPMRSPSNHSLMMHMTSRKKMLQHLPSTVTEMRETMENPTPVGSYENESFMMEGEFLKSSFLGHDDGSPEDEPRRNEDSLLRWSDLGLALHSLHEKGVAGDL